MKKIHLARRIPEALMEVPTRARKIRIPFGHEGGDEPMPMSDLLQDALEKRRRVGRIERGLVPKRDLHDPRAGLFVDVVDRDAVRVAGIEDVAIERVALPDAHGGIATHTRVERDEIAEGLLPKRMGRLPEEPELVLDCKKRQKTVDLGAGDDGSKQISWARRVRPAVFAMKIDEHVRKPRRLLGGSQRVQVDFGDEIGVTRMGACNPVVRIEGVLDIPAEDHIAEAETLFERAVKFLGGDDLCSEDSVDIRASDFDLADAAPLKIVANAFEVQIHLLHAISGGG